MEINYPDGDEIICPFCRSDAIVEEDKLINNYNKYDIEDEYTLYLCMDCNKRF